MRTTLQAQPSDKQAQHRNRTRLELRARPLPSLLAYLVGGGVWLCAGLASAQSADGKAVEGDEGSTLPSVTVTANKRAQAAQDVAAAVNVLSAKKLEDENIGRSANEIINYIPNASAYGAPHGRPRWWIRGVGTGIPQQDLPNPVGFYLDEVYFPNASATNFPIFDLSRVEVLSGPQGTLWGKNTTGGAINIVSREPRFKQDGYVKLGYGTYNTKIYEGAVGGTLVEDLLAFRVSGHLEDQGKRYKNLYTGQKEGDLQDGAYRFQLLGTFTNDFEGLLNLHYRKLRTTGGSTFGSPAEGKDYYYPLVRFNFPTGQDEISSLDGNRWSRGDTSQNGANLKLRWRFGDYELTSISAYEDYDNSGTGGPGSPFVSGANWTYNTYYEKWLSQELRLASPRNDRFNWILGGHYFYDTIDTNGRSVQLVGYPTIANRTSTNSSLTDDGYEHKTISRAIFGSATYNFTKQLDATLGLRFTQEYKSYGYYRNAWAGANVPQQDQWWTNTTGTGSTATSFPRQGLNKSWDAITY
jgi:iron complex outermembrane receptor protein